MKIKTFFTCFSFLAAMFVYYSCSKKTASVKTADPASSIPSHSTNQAALWKELPKAAFQLPDTSLVRYNHYRLFALDSAAMQELLMKAKKNPRPDDPAIRIALPRPDSGFMQFIISRTTVMDSALEAKYPLLRTYEGTGMNRKDVHARLDFNINGFHAYISGSEGEWFIQPVKKGITHQFLLCFFKQDAWIQNRQPFELPDSLRK